jgi:hypothetical protein
MVVMRRELRTWSMLSVGAVLVAAACGSSDESSGDGDDRDGGPVLDLDAGRTYEGGTMPLPDGGLNALRDASCAGWSAAGEPLPSVIMLVVDISGSMNADDPTGSGMSKWEVTEPALRDAIATLPATTAVGILFYPNQTTSESNLARDPSECVREDAMIPIAQLGAAGSLQRDRIDDSLASTSPINSGTPTHDAYQLALEQLEATTLAGNKYMLLITDGQPTFLQGCIGSGLVTEPVDEQPIVDAIAAANGDGIKTFVIGSPGSEENQATLADARPWLSQAAEAGGTAPAGCSSTGPTNYCHFDMTVEDDFGDGLARALGAIAGQIVSCDYLLPAPPPDQTLDPDRVNVVYTPGVGDPLLVLRSSAADCTAGWRYSADGTRIVLCSDTCDTALADPDARLELMFGCATETGPIE